jgi:hypothetical protein
MINNEILLKIKNNTIIQQVIGLTIKTSIITIKFLFIYHLTFAYLLTKDSINNKHILSANVKKQ